LLLSQIQQGALDRTEPYVERRLDRTESYVERRLYGVEAIVRGAQTLVGGSNLLSDSAIDISFEG
jgi:hypothetical protein